MEEKEERHDVDHRRNHPAEKQESAEESSPAELAARERIASRNPEDQRRSGGERRDDDRVEQRMRVAVLEQRAEVIERQGTDENRRRGVSDHRLLERGQHNPQERDPNQHKSDEEKQDPESQYSSASASHSHA